MKDSSGKMLDVEQYQGHATQILWMETTELGCATDTCDSTTLLVCNYNPP